MRTKSEATDPNSNASLAFLTNLSVDCVTSSNISEHTRNLTRASKCTKTRRFESKSEECIKELIRPHEALFTENHEHNLGCIHNALLLMQSIV